MHSESISCQWVVLHPFLFFSPSFFLFFMLPKIWPKLGIALIACRGSVNVALPVLHHWSPGWVSVDHSLVFMHALALLLMGSMACWCILSFDVKIEIVIVSGLYHRASYMPFSGIIFVKFLYCSQTLHYLAPLITPLNIFENIDLLMLGWHVHVCCPLWFWFINFVYIIAS